MRTKTLLLSAVALAAGLLTSQAQSNVYSANVVGYAQVVYAGGSNGVFSLVANPFDDGNGNLMTNVVERAGANPLPPGSQILIWDNVLGYVTTKKSAGGVWN